METVASVQETSGSARRGLAAVAAGLALVGSYLAGCAGEKDATSRDQGVPPVTVPAIEVPAFEHTEDRLLSTITPSSGSPVKVYGIEGPDGSMYIHIDSDKTYTGTLEAECEPDLPPVLRLRTNDSSDLSTIYTIKPPQNFNPCVGGVDTLSSDPKKVGDAVIYFTVADVMSQGSKWGGIPVA
jgi:hypothetical protein